MERVSMQRRGFFVELGINSEPSSPERRDRREEERQTTEDEWPRLRNRLVEQRQVAFLDLRISHTSFSATLPRIRMATSAGTSVIARTNAATSASMIVIAIGENVLPSVPVNVSSGANASRMIA